MIASGVIGLPLHPGRLPNWFADRMGTLGTAVIESIVQNYGKSEVLSRLSSPLYMQALAAVAGISGASVVGTSPAGRRR